MNQKRIITNQILEQKNFTLNSTLNYLFNISNMKKLFSYLLISSMVILSSCTNYDDQFDDLNAQINTLKSQIEGFSSLSTGLTALQGTVSSLQSAVAALPTTATPATDISGLEASSATNATSIAALQTALDALSTTLAAMQTTLAGAATATEITVLQTELDLVQADLAELLASNNIYTGDVIVNNAATLTAVEQLGNKVGIVNGNVYVTQSATNGIDATKLQAVVSKMTTVTGAVSYTHSGASVVAVDFTALKSAGSVSLVQDAPISLPALTSTGAAIFKENADATKMTSISAPVLTTVTSFKNATIDQLGSSSVTSISLPALVRYPNATLKLTVKSTGDTTVSLTALTSTNGTTGLQQDLALTLVGGDDLVLAAFENGTVTAENVKTLTLPKFVINASADLSTGASKLETLAIHEVRTALTFSGYTNLESLDVIGTSDTSVNNTDILGSVSVTGSSPDLTTVSFAGKLLTASVVGATDVTSVTTSGMIRSFTLSGSTDIETLTLGHAGITGVTGTNATALNDTNAGELVIRDNTNLTTFTAESVATLGKLHITGNDALTSFNLKSTLGIGASATTRNTGKETVDVNISNNDLTGSVQYASAFDVAPVVSGAITQASIENISAYIVAAEAAIKHGLLMVAATKDDDPSYSRVTGIYSQAAEASGGANTGYVLTSMEVVIDNLSAATNADGTDDLSPVGSTPATDFEVVSIDSVGAADSGAKANNPISTYYADYGGSVNVIANGQTVSFDSANDANLDDEIASLDTNAIWSANNIDLTITKGVNKRTGFTLSGLVSKTTSIVSMTFVVGGVTHTVTGTTSTNSAVFSDTAAGFVSAFNDYTDTNSPTVKIKATKVGNTGEINFHTGSYSGTTFVVDVFNSAYLTNPQMVVYDDSAFSNTGTVGAQTLTDGYAITATSVSSLTGAYDTIAELGFSVAGGTAVADAGAVTESSFTQKTPSTTHRREGEYVAASGAATAVIKMRAAWL